jgi:hypothetical protein
MVDPLHLPMKRIKHHVSNNPLGPSLQQVGVGVMRRGVGWGGRAFKLIKGMPFSILNKDYEIEKCFRELKKRNCFESFNRRDGVKK